MKFSIDLFCLLTFFDCKHVLTVNIILFQESLLKLAASDGAKSTQEKNHNGDQTSSKARSWLNWLSLGMLGAGGTSDTGSFAGVVSDEIIKVGFFLTLSS